MSRFDHESACGRYLFSYGVDHATSVFVHVVDTTKPEEQRYVVQADNMGVFSKESLLETPFQVRVVKELVDAFELCRSQGNFYPNIDKERIMLIARSFGVELDGCEVYANLDSPP
jgi:hypothetical protein